MNPSEDSMNNGNPDKGASAESFQADQPTPAGRAPVARRGLGLLIASVAVLLGAGLFLILFAGGARSLLRDAGGSLFASGGIREVTVANFQKVVVSPSMDQPVLIEFFTDRCPSCMKMEPVLREIAEEMRGKVVVGKVPPSERQLFKLFEVQPVPAIFILRDAEVRKAYEGVVPKDLLINDLTELGSPKAPKGG